MDEILSATCEHCDEPHWKHVSRRNEIGLDILPCLPMVIDYVGKERWYRFADEYDNCLKCGKPLYNHFVFERAATRVMGSTIWDRSPVAFLFPRKELSCAVVSEEGPLLGRVPPPPDATSIAPAASVTDKPARRIPIRAMLNQRIDHP